MESRMMKALQKINFCFEKYEYGMSMATMGISTLITIVQVVTRYGFNHLSPGPKNSRHSLWSG